MRTLIRDLLLLLLPAFVAGCQTHSGGTVSHEALQIRSGEEVLDTRPANLWRGMEAVGGALTITSQRLLFQPHHFNVQKAFEEISLAEVVRVVPIDYGIIFKTKDGVLVELRSGVTFRFVVNDRAQVIDMIRTAVERIQRLSNKSLQPTPRIALVSINASDAAWLSSSR